MVICEICGFDEKICPILMGEKIPGAPKNLTEEKAQKEL